MTMTTATTITMAILMLLLIAPATLAISFEDEIITQSLTTFSWEFRNPWGEEKGGYNEYLVPYIDNLGCPGATIRVYALTPVTYRETECADNIECSDVLVWNETLGKQIPKQECHFVKDCSEAVKTVIEKYDLEKTDFLLGKDDRILVEGTRKAAVGDGNICDMNFNYQDGTADSFRTVDYMKAWWNLTFQYKNRITFTRNTALTRDTQFAVKIVFNTSTINYSFFQSDGGDIRFTDSTESYELPYFIEKWNKTGISVMYVNATITNSTDTDVYMYYNTSSALASNSSFTRTFSSELYAFYTMNFDANDTSDVHHTATSAVNLVRKDVQYDNDTSPALYNYNGATYIVTNQTWSIADGVPFAVSIILNVTNNTGANRRSYNAQGTNSYITQIQANYSLSFQAYDGSWASLFSGKLMNNTQYAFLHTYDGIDSWKLYQDGTLFASLTSDESGYSNAGYWQIGRSPAGTEYWYGDIDEVRYYQGVNLTADFAKLLYEQPNITIAAASSSSTETAMYNGLLVDWVNRSNNTVIEGEDFRFYSIFEYSMNHSRLNSSFAICNYSGINLSDENYFSNTTNLTICGGGSCGSGQSYVQLNVSGLPTENLVFDVYRFRLCYNQAPPTSFTIRTNCSADVQTVPGADLPACADGYVNYSIKNNWCTNGSSVSINISNPVAFAQRITLVNSFYGIDRFGNFSGNLSWNSSAGGGAGLWVSPEFEHYQHGNTTANFTCTAFPEGVVNQTNSLNYAVQNTNPSVYLNTISDWFNGAQSFTNGIVVKYPLVSTLNISGACEDDDWSTTILNLTYTNGTVVTSTTFTAPSQTVNYTPGNFTMNTLRNATLFCNDTEGLSSVITKQFNTSNLAPTFSWDNATGQSFASMPLNFTITCTDPENQTTQKWYWINDTLNQSSVTADYFNVTLPVGVYKLTGLCQDGSINSSNASIVFTYSVLCDHTILGMADGTRYQDNTAPGLGMSCTNGINITACWYRINHFNTVSIPNCSNFNVSLELGWNRINFTAYAGADNTSLSFDVWAKKYDSDSFADYAIIVVSMLIAIALFVIGGFLRSRLFFFLAGVGGLVIGYELLAFSMVSGLFVVFCSGLFSLAVMFRSNAN